MIEHTTFICAIGHNIAVVLDGDEWIKQEIDDLSHHLDDLAIEYPEKFGLYIWSGTVEIDDPDTMLPEPVYKGKYTLLSDWNGFTPNGRGE
jgi:hypothetical protein